MQGKGFPWNSLIKKVASATINFILEKSVENSQEETLEDTLLNILK